MKMIYGDGDTEREREREERETGGGTSEKMIFCHRARVGCGFYF
jgi:hypothetical protein